MTTKLFTEILPVNKEFFRNVASFLRYSRPLARRAGPEDAAANSKCNRGWLNFNGLCMIKIFMGGGGGGSH